MKTVMWFVKPSAFLCAGSLVLGLLCGCESAGPNTQRGAVFGAGLGALGGAIIGHQSGRSLEGLGIGAAAGALAGGLIGNSMDQTRTPPPPPPPPPVVVAAPVPAPPPPSPVVVTQSPPAPPVEVVSPAPGPGYAWVSGYWSWQGAWVWVPGNWMVQPRPAVIWVPGHWIRHRHGWIWMEGHWQ